MSRRFRRWLLGMAVAALAAHAANARSRHFRLLAEADGLPAPAVGALAQDGRGFIWVVTAGGLYRYDGVEMRRVLGRLESIIIELAARDDGVVARLEDETVIAVDLAGF